MSEYKEFTKKRFPDYAPIISNEDFGKDGQPITAQLFIHERNPLAKEMGERIPIFRQDGTMFVRIQGKVYKFKGDLIS